MCIVIGNRSGLGQAQDTKDKIEAESKIKPDFPGGGGGGDIRQYMGGGGKALIQRGCLLNFSLILTNENRKNVYTRML